MAYLFTIQPNGSTYATDGVTCVRLDAMYPTLQKIGAIGQGYGPDVTLAEVGDLLTYDPATGLLRPLKDVIAGAAPPARQVGITPDGAAILARQVAALLPTGGGPVDVSALAKAIIREQGRLLTAA